MPNASPASISSEQTYTAATTFLRVPRVSSADGADLAFLGIPFDLATSNRPGTRFGPAAIRAASAQLAELPAYPGGFDPLDHVNAVDLGDVYLRHSDPASIPKAIETAASSAIQAGATLVGLGGDHFITLPLLRATAHRHGTLALIQFDAHTDTWEDLTPQNEGLLLDHGTMFRKAVGEGVIAPSRSIQVGIRTWVEDPLGIAILDNVACEDLSIKQIGDSIRRTVGEGPCYLTVDIDCLDPAFAPGTGTPVTGGLTPLRLLRILREIADLNIVGCDVVEVSPAYDASGITALNAATVVYEQLCRVARRKGAAARSYTTSPSTIDPLRERAGQSG
ncbi:Agmatinase [Escherichia coli]|uniref:agmatinase n=1 Tax=Escherichia coli TaxID=562 RepID=UPI001A400310|nr:agmatinase [Escherichia coli]VVY65916.1 Agmatinase [Escherichia coli]VVY68353.1 Agmatinase [Escherichia coli]VVY70411.1 Agmatinase [Escherichia coli]VVY70907.1 Agmatinase [Escherichia coli]VVY71212.1 Agmatinase [Escherichia coli]